MKLEEKLTLFKKKNKYVKMNDQIFDISSCFIHSSPQNFGVNPVVLAYTVQNGLVVQKYEPGSRPRIKKFSLELEVLSCLCLEDIRNLSVSEVWTYVKNSKKSKRRVSGISKKEVLRICEELLINPDKDQAFMFASSSYKTSLNRLQLNRIWLDQFLTYGNKALQIMTNSEYNVLYPIYKRFLFTEITDEVLKPHSYMYGRSYHTKDSVIFLKRKLQLAQSFS